MKRKLLKGMSSIFLSIIVGFLCGYLVYSTYKEETKYLVNNDIVYMIEYQKYSDYESMKLANISKDYTYYKDNDNYYTVIGFTRDKDNINKIFSIYEDVNIIECYIEDKDFLNELDLLDEKIKNSEDNNEIKEILNAGIQYYNENEIELLKIYN